MNNTVQVQKKYCTKAAFDAYVAVFVVAAAANVVVAVGVTAVAANVAAFLAVFPAPGLRHVSLWGYVCCTCTSLSCFSLVV